MVIHATLSSGLCVHNWRDVRAAFPGLAQAVRQDVRIPNPEYLKAKQYRLSTRGIQSWLNCFDWNTHANTMTLPAGYLGRFKTHVLRAGGQLEVADTRALQPAPPVQSEITLRDYQEPAVQAVLDALNGMGITLLEAPAGSGKTEMALEIAARLGQTTLWIAHTKDLADQVRERAMLRLGLKARDIGMIGDRREKIGQFLTIGLVQTLARRDMSQWERAFGTVCIDECHHTPATTWSQVLASLAPRYKFGVTATLERNDGLEAITHLYLGPTSYAIDREATPLIIPRLNRVTTDIVPEAWKSHVKAEEEYKKQHEAYTARMAEVQSLFNQGLRVPMPAEPKKPRMNYNRIINDLLENEERNQLLVDHIAKHAPGRHSVVISARVSHCEHLKELLAEHIPPEQMAVIHGNKSKTRRREILAAANSGDITLIFSVDIMKEGIDIPLLDQLFLVAGGRDKIMIEQAVGRIQRPHPDKTDAIIHDFIDEEVGVLQAQQWQRNRVYRQLGIFSSRRASA